METSAKAEQQVSQIGKIVEFTLSDARHALLAYAEELVRYGKDLEKAIQDNNLHSVANWIVAISSQSNNTVRLAGRWQAMSNIQSALSGYFNEDDSLVR